MKRFVVLCCCTVTLMVSACKEQVVPPPATVKSVEAAPPAVAEVKLPPTVDKAGLVALLAKHKGQPILLNVFASWCVPCKNELPALAKFASEHPRFVFIGIDVDQKDDDLKSFLPSIPKAFTVYRRADGFEPLVPALGLPKDWDEAVPPGWARTVPVTLVFEKSGAFGTGSVGQLIPEAMEAFAKLDTAPGNAGSGSPAK